MYINIRIFILCTDHFQISKSHLKNMPCSNLKIEIELELNIYEKTSKTLTIKSLFIHVRV